MTTLHTYAQFSSYAEHQRLYPDSYVRDGGHCQEFARSCAGVPGYANSALDAALMVPKAHRFTHPQAGMMGFAAYRTSAGYKQYGHAFSVVENSYCYSTDLPRHGRVGKVPISLITGRSGWNMPILWYSDWTPFGLLHLKPGPPVHAPGLPQVDLSMIQAASKTDPGKSQGYALYRTGTVVVERAMVKAGFLPAAYGSDGSFGSLTRTGYKRVQALYRSPYRDGIPRMADLTAFGKKFGFTVVA